MTSPPRKSVLVQGSLQGLCNCELPGSTRRRGCVQGSQSAGNDGYDQTHAYCPVYIGMHEEDVVPRPPPPPGPGPGCHDYHESNRSGAPRTRHQPSSEGPGLLTLPKGEMPRGSSALPRTGGRGGGRAGGRFGFVASGPWLTGWLHPRLIHPPATSRIAPYAAGIRPEWGGWMGSLRLSAEQRRPRPAAVMA